MVERLKIALLGSTGVGKTAILTRFLTNRYIADYCPTLEDVYSKAITVQPTGSNGAEIPVELEMLDTAGDLYAIPWSDTYAHWADHFVLIYAVNDRDSFEAIPTLKEHIDGIRAGCPSNTSQFLLIGNKTDLSDYRQASTADGEELADEFGMQFFELNCIDASSVKQIHATFREFATRCIEASKNNRRPPLPGRLSAGDFFKHAWSNFVKKSKLQRINSV